ncbi:MAG: bifunctional methylenetetrahydrofolate dehydrogenase/methenyltetrahydrofolate cyclohydrolase FolD [Alphaproteobacteria bacterium]
MSTAQIIDGKTIAAGLRARVAKAVCTLDLQQSFTPGLAVVLVGENAASKVYVRNKARHTEEAGMLSIAHRLSADTSEADLLALIERLNADNTVDGILVQLPLPDHINTTRVLEAVSPAKDVDGFHPINAGRLASGGQALTPCTPLGCVLLAKTAAPSLEGMDAVVVGRSNIVGKPVAQLLLRENCTVTIAHSRSRDLPDVVRRADLVVAAVGRPLMVKGDWIKPGAIVIDVGINRVPSVGDKTRLVGDVDFETAQNVAGAITPVPGGVGPMTIACLLRNTVEAACMRRGVSVPEM